MAKRNSVSASRSVDEAGGAAVPGWHLPAAVAELLEMERLRMMRARTILQCVTLAMDQPTLPERQPYYSDAIDVACDLIDEAVRRLDRVHVLQAGTTGVVHDPMLAPSGGYMVRDAAMMDRVERCSSADVVQLLSN